MSDATRNELSRLTSDSVFQYRVSRANIRLVRRNGNAYQKTHPVRSTSKKTLAYYRGDAPNFRMVFYEDADPERVNDTMVTLQALGVSPDSL